MTPTSVAAGKPSMNPMEQTMSVMEPSQIFRVAGLMAMMPWMMVWKTARHWEMPRRMKIK